MKITMNGIFGFIILLMFYTSVFSQTPGLKRTDKAAGSRDLLQTIVDNSVNYYRKLKQISQLPGYELIIIPTENWADHTAKVEWNFEAGYAEGDKLYATVPHTTAQLEVFPTIESVLRYTVAKAMLVKHLAGSAPEWFQYGYAAYEAQLERPYETIREIYADSGKFPDISGFESFDPENNIRQRDLAFSMGEYAMLIQGDYPKFPSFYNGRITLLSANQTKANDLWHLFLEKHYLESAERVKILVKNEKIAIYGASKDSAKAPMYLETLTSQLQFYEDSFKVTATHRINVLINPDRCTQLLVEGYECDNNQGGGGHGSGLGGCAFISPSFNNYRDFIWLMTHEFTHVYQFWLRSNFMPAWLSEGFASCMPKIRTNDAFEYLKVDMFNKWTIVRRNLGRDPTISELMDYNFVRTNNIDYYGMGWLMIDYIVKNDGYLAVRKIIESNGLDFTSMGYSKKEDFMRYFYQYFDIRIMKKEIVTLISPQRNIEYPTTNIDISWSALSGNIPLDLEVSTNGGGQWAALLSGTNDSQFTWAAPSEFRGDFFLKFSVPSNLNISKVYGPFKIIESSGENNFLGPYAADENTILLLHFDNNLTNQSSQSDDGISHGDGISYVSSAYSNLEKCLSIDNAASSSQSYISIPHNDNLNLTGDWTIEAWFYMKRAGSNASVNPTIISKGDGSGQNFFVWYHNSWDQLKGQYSNTLGSDKFLGIGSLVSTGKWYHIAFIRNAANYTETLILHDKDKQLIYKESAARTADESIPKLNSEDILIGKLFSANNFYFDGYIDEVRISSVARLFDPVSVNEKESVEIVTDYKLNQNYPNPFNPSTVIKYGIPKSGMVNLKVYDILGNEVSVLVNESQNAGMHSVSFDASRLGSGVYIYTITSGEFSRAKKMLLLK